MTFKKRIVIIGGGGHAKSLISVIKKCKTFQIVGYVDLCDHGKILGIPWVGTDHQLKVLKMKYRSLNAAIGIGSTDLSSKRPGIVERVLKAGLTLPVIISPDAIVNTDVKIGNATVVFDGVVINAGTSLGQACILNTGCIVDHDCVIGDFVHIAPGVVLSGGVKVAGYSLIGTGARVIQGRKICRDSLIGAGAVVCQDIKIAGTYVGVPARRIGR